MSRRPRLEFAGVGWIGLERLRAVADDGAADIVAIVDPDEEACGRACQAAPTATVVSDFDAMLGLDLDGVVIATPSALHAAQAEAALDRKLAVFCQKPLARTGDEVRGILRAARSSDRLLGVDLSYRHTAALRAVRALAWTGELGRIYAADLVFHNAHGPDKPWFLDPDRSGGGAVVDLGIHLVDGALWVLDFPEVRDVRATLFKDGERLRRPPGVNETYAMAEIQLATGAQLRLTCSWFLPAGRDAVIEATFWGTRGAASMRNVDGSFYDFVGERFVGRTTERLTSPPDAWGGRAAVAWARRLATDRSYDPAADRHEVVADVLDAIYGR